MQRPRLWILFFHSFFILQPQYSTTGFNHDTQPRTSTTILSIEYWGWVSCRNLWLSIVELLQPQYSTTDFYTILSHDTQPWYSVSWFKSVVEYHGWSTSTTDFNYDTQPQISTRYSATILSIVVQVRGLSLWLSIMVEVHALQLRYLTTDFNHDTNYRGWVPWLKSMVEYDMEL